MRVNGSSLCSPQNRYFNVSGINQSLAKRAGSVRGEKGEKNQDRATISPQGRLFQMIESLTNQKATITERKNQFVASAMEQGQSSKVIQAQVDLYNEQIANIEKQITQLTAQQMKQEAEKNQPKVEDKQPKTEEEIENKTLANISEISASLERIDTVEAVKTDVDGRAGILESEIAMDKMRIGDPKMTGSLEAIEEKEGLLSQLKEKSLDLTEKIGEELTNISETAKENTDLATTEPIEQEEPSSSEPNPHKEDEESNPLQERENK